MNILGHEMKIFKRLIQTILVLALLSSSLKANYHPGFPIASPWVHTPQMDPFSNMGLALSAYPPPKINTFNKDWYHGGYKAMYNMNFMAPYAMDVASHGHGNAPLTTLQNFNTFPTYLTNGQYNPYGFNLGDPRYHALYQRYYGFFNKDLNLIAQMAKHKVYGDYNNLRGFKNRYPSMFDSDRTFSGISEASVSPPFLVAGGTRQSDRLLYLKKNKPSRPIRSKSCYIRFSLY